jgi:hypothetical protein
VSLASSPSHEHKFSSSSSLQRMRDIALLRVLARLRYVVGHLPVIALLAQAALLVALVLALQLRTRSRSLRICVVDHPHQEAPLLPHHAAAAVAVVARHHIRHVTNERDRRTRGRDSRSPPARRRRTQPTSAQPYT